MINLDEVQQKFPFLSGLRCQSHEYIGIIQNSDDKIISFYDYESIRTPEEKILFLVVGKQSFTSYQYFYAGPNDSISLLPKNYCKQGCWNYVWLGNKPK